jgi:hypothetical protein
MVGRSVSTPPRAVNQPLIGWSTDDQPVRARIGWLYNQRLINGWSTVGMIASTGTAEPYEVANSNRNAAYSQQWGLLIVAPEWLIAPGASLWLEGRSRRRHNEWQTCCILKLATKSSALWRTKPRSSVITWYRGHASTLFRQFYALTKTPKHIQVRIYGYLPVSSRIPELI